MKKLLLIILILIIGGGFLFYRTKIFKKSESSNSQNVNLEIEVIEEKKEEKKESPEIEKPEEIQIPKEVNLGVPFTPQAPYAIWDVIHNEACEEAALLMVHKFWANESLTPEIAEEEILKLVDFQNKNYGDFKDTDSEETAQLIKDYYGYKRVEVKYDIILEDIKRELAKGRPVIVSAAGRLLKNPYFKRPGPLYHNLVIKGFDEKGIITNDPGTWRGADYIYDPDILMEAIRDWNDGDIYNGRKAMIVIYPN